MTNTARNQERNLSERQVVLRKATRLIWWITGVIEALIGIRVLLKMMAANPGNPFADFIYSLTDLLLWPFSGLTATPSSGGVVLEVSSVIAMIIYMLVAWLVIEFLWLVMGRERA